MTLDPNAAPSHPASHERAAVPDLTEEQRQRIFREEQLKGMARPMFGRPWLAGLLMFVFLAGAFALLVTPSAASWGVKLVLGALFSAVATIVFFSLDMFARVFARAKLAQRNIAVRTEELQERLDENFFTNLVKINFKYIDKYYLQTQVQANKSFLLSCFAAVVSFGVVVAGIVLIYVNETQATAGYVAAGAGCLGEFVAAVFFYLYNQTIIKMGEYHQKLVLTQNIGLALKITDDLQGESQTNARIKLIETLTSDINRYLTATSVAAPAKPQVIATS